jgi:hypothetical protein
MRFLEIQFDLLLEGFGTEKIFKEFTAEISSKYWKSAKQLLSNKFEVMEGELVEWLAMLAEPVAAANRIE